jgi:hypothetical protein
MKMVKQRKFQIKACAAAAALCVVGSAHADTDNSVTLYGIADVGLMYLSHSTPELNGGMSNGHQISLTNSGYSPSLWGIKGVEDLGGGFKAQFNLESGISMVNGGFDNPGDNKGLFNRVADVGISGNFGKVMAGLQFSPFFELIYDLDPRDSSMFGSMLVPGRRHLHAEFGELHLAQLRRIPVVRPVRLGRCRRLLFDWPRLVCRGKVLYRNTTDRCCLHRCQ